MDLKSILAGAKDEKGELHSGYDQSWRPTAGSYTVKVVKVNHGVTKTKGDPRIGVWLEVLEGADAGSRWWENITLFADNPAAAAVNFGKLLAMGVEESTIEALNDVAAIAPLLEDWEGTARVELKANPNKPDDPYVNTYFSPRDATPQAQTLESEVVTQLPAETGERGF